VISLDDDGETFSLFALLELEDALEDFELRPTPPTYNIKRYKYKESHVWYDMCYNACASAQEVY